MNSYDSTNLNAVMALRVFSPQIAHARQQPGKLYTYDHYKEHAESFRTWLDA